MVTSSRISPCSEALTLCGCGCGCADQHAWPQLSGGRSGRLKLAKSPKEINIGQVLRAIEDWNVVECFQASSNQCRITRGCGLQLILREAVDVFLAVLDRYSLEDVIRRKSALVQMLGLRTA